jgi:peroxiredoxin
MNWKFLLTLTALVFAAAVTAQTRNPAAWLEQRFEQLDRNRDGKLSAAEAGNAGWFKSLDRDQDGLVTREEARQLERALNGVANRPTTAAGGQLFRRLDKNGDGVLTRDELPGLAQFDTLDTNRDGALTLEEARAAVDALAARRGGLNSLARTGTGPIPELESPREGPVRLKPGDAGVGRLVPDLEFVDLDGRPGRLSDYRGQTALVIALTSVSCPVGKRFTPALARLEKQFGERGAAFLYVNPTASDAPEAMRAVIREHGLTGRYVQDAGGALVGALGARTSTEVFVLDAARTLVYRGAVSDQYGLAYSLDTPRHEFLADALVAVLAGRAPAVAATTAPGCALEAHGGDQPAPPANDSRSAATAGGPTTSTVTYHNQIARILQNYCVECHRPGGVAPFSLETYENARSHAAMMRRQVEKGLMPPWFAAPPPPGESSPWANDRSLSPRDKADLLAWLASPDKPAGDPADAPLPRRFPGEWTIGEPDAVFQLPRPVFVKAEGTMPYQFLTVETSFPEDRWVNAYEILPTAREVVHHVIVKVHPRGTAVRDADEGTEGYWAAYVPGNASRVLPAGFAKKLPAGATISFQIHYTPNGKAVEEQLRLGVKFAKQPPQYAVHVAAVPKVTLQIPPGAAHHVETVTQRVPADLLVSAFMAHMHVRGKAFKYELIHPDGREETLLDIPRYDFNWQLRYELAQPRLLPAGSTLKLTAVYDNSAGNPANPDPTATVRWGPQTFHEMMIGYLEFYTRADAPVRSTGIRGPRRAGASGQ